jgi:putative transposase
VQGCGIEKSSVNRELVQASAARLQELCEKKLAGFDLVAIFIDGIRLGGQVLVVALGLEITGQKHVLGLWQGATENTTVVKGLLEDLVARGLDPQRRYLLVIDGAKALRAGIERVFGQRAEVQRCQIHKLLNVAEHLPKKDQGDYARRIRNAYAIADCAAAKAELQEIFRQLERINPSAVHSLEDGLEETFMVHRLGIGWLLRRTLASTNPLESCLSTVEFLARNAKRWREGEQALRWTATGLLEAQKKFRRVKGYRELELLHRRMNPSLTQQAQLA